MAKAELRSCNSALLNFDSDAVSAIVLVADMGKNHVPQLRMEYFPHEGHRLRIGKMAVF